MPQNPNNRSMSNKNISKLATTMKQNKQRNRSQHQKIRGSFGAGRQGCENKKKNKGKYDDGNVSMRQRGNKQTAKTQVGKLVVPFNEDDNILLVGEGDLSYAFSLTHDHKCRFITATCYDSEEALYQKYPHSREILNTLLLNRDGKSFPGYEVKQNNGSFDAIDKRDREDESRKRKICGEKEATETNDLSELGPDNGSARKVRRLREESAERTLTGLTANPSLGDQVSAQPAEIACEHVSPNPSITATSNNLTKTTADISFYPSISATKLSSYKSIRRNGPYDKIIFNFPHVGGVSTDVNRQVRANQELLVGFFEECKRRAGRREKGTGRGKGKGPKGSRLLVGKGNPAPRIRSLGTKSSGMNNSQSEKYRHHRDGECADDGDLPEDDSTSSLPLRSLATPTRITTTGHAQQCSNNKKGQIIITLFTRPPYTLWNIRDLARHCGYRVVTSWTFLWQRLYPNYRHARTVGEIARKGKAQWRGGGRKGSRDDVEKGEQDGDEEQKNRVHIGSNDVVSTTENHKADAPGQDEDINNSKNSSVKQEAREAEANSRKKSITSRDATVSSRQSSSFWRGEDRDARSYLFELVTSDEDGNDDEDDENSQNDHEGHKRDGEKKELETEDSDSDD